MITSVEIKDLITAISSTQGEIEIAIKERTNPFFNSKYATLDEILSTCREPFKKNNLALSQAPSFVEGRLVLTTRIFHISGQWIESQLSLKPAQDTPQAIGSCITYARRYALASLVGIITEDDDDGHKASDKETEKEKLLTKENNAQKIEIQKLKKEIEDLKKEKPKRIFDANNNMHVESLIKNLKEKHSNDISSESYPLIIEELHGKDFDATISCLLTKYKGK